MYRFKSVDYRLFDEKLLEKYNGNIYTTITWLKVLNKADKVEPLLIEISQDDKNIGYFVGALTKKFGIKIIGSPFKGWTTPYMGFLLDEGIESEYIIKDLWKYLIKEYHCLYAEICDPHFNEENLKKNNLDYITSTTYMVNIDNDIENVFKGFSSHRRQHIKHFEKYGGGIEKVLPNDTFINDFYKMTEDVFGLQGLKPSFTKEKTRVIFEALPEDYIYCSKAYNKDKKCIGMAAVFGYGTSCQTFMVVTDHNEKYDQNAALFWEAMKYWNKKGKKTCDLLGKRPYKEGFRPYEPIFYRVILSKYKLLFILRNIAKKTYWKVNHLKYKLKVNNK